MNTTKYSATKNDKNDGSMRKKSKFDESFSEKEIELIDKLIDTSIKKGQIVDEKSLIRALR